MEANLPNQFAQHFLDGINAEIKVKVILLYFFSFRHSIYRMEFSLRPFIEDGTIIEGEESAFQMIFFLKCISNDFKFDAY
jgi:hypothetical protein